MQKPGCGHSGKVINKSSGEGFCSFQTLRWLVNISKRISFDLVEHQWLSIIELGNSYIADENNPQSLHCSGGITVAATVRGSPTRLFPHNGFDYGLHPISGLHVHMHSPRLPLLYNWRIFSFSCAAHLWYFFNFNSPLTEERIEGRHESQRQNNGLKLDENLNSPESCAAIVVIPTESPQTILIPLQRNEIVFFVFSIEWLEMKDDERQL